MSIRCFLGFHRWGYFRGVFFNGTSQPRIVRASKKCEICGKQKSISLIKYWAEQNCKRYL